MRTTHCCPKCEHTSVLYVPEVTDTESNRSILSKHGGLWTAPTIIGEIEAYVCRGCGYTELYTRGASAIDPTKIDGAVVLEAKQRRPGPTGR